MIVNDTATVALQGKRLACFQGRPRDEGAQVELFRFWRQLFFLLSSNTLRRHTKPVAHSRPFLVGRSFTIGIFGA